MKNFIMLTKDNGGTQFCIPVSNIKLVEPTSNGTMVYVINEPFEYRYVKESVEEISKKIENVTEGKVEFIKFIFTNLNVDICVKTSEILYLKEGSKNWHKVCIEGMGEIEVYGDFHRIVDSLNSVTISGV